MDPRACVVQIAASSHSHNNLLERTIAGSLTDAIDGAFDLTGSGCNGS
jgi:hypothetical protein